MAHYCSIHKTPFFKKGKMKNYAHPIKDADGNDTGEWCNEPEESEKQEKPFTYSPEKSASIETQVAVKAVTDLWIADKLPTDCQEVTLLRSWLLAHLNGVNPTATVVENTEKPATEKTMTKTQKEMLKKFYEDMPGKVEEFMTELGFDKKLTPSQADVLIAKLIIEQETKK